jgi:hypothetical protein
MSFGATQLWYRPSQVTDLKAIRGRMSFMRSLVMVMKLLNCPLVGPYLVLHLLPLLRSSLSVLSSFVFSVILSSTNFTKKLSSSVSTLKKWKSVPLRCIKTTF